MKYTLQLFKDNNVGYDWNTIYVGRRLRIISHSVVNEYALELLEDNEDIDNAQILELAWTLEEDETDKELKVLISQINDSDLREGSTIWNIEARKWRCCILSELLITINDEQALYEEIEKVFSKFNCPSDMYEFFRNISDKHFYSIEKRDNILKGMKDIILQFIEKEKVELNIGN